MEDRQDACGRDRSIWPPLDLFGVVPVLLGFVSNKCSIPQDGDNPLLFLGIVRAILLYSWQRGAASRNYLGSSATSGRNLPVLIQATCVLEPHSARLRLYCNHGEAEVESFRSS